jgi:TRAP transporter TAXI family solute receptor
MRLLRIHEALIVALVAITLVFANAQQLGIKAKKPILGAACKVCPWGALGEIVKQALQTYGYDVQICYHCFRADAPRIVAGAKLPPPWEETVKNFPMIARSDIPPPPNGPVEFGVTNINNVRWAYAGTHVYSGEEPRKNLRLFAVIQSPSYLIVAARADLGISDLSQIRQKRWPVRILTGVGNEADTILAYYGLTRQAIESAGGHIASGGIPQERKNFDVIIAGGTLGNAPEFNVWYEVSQKFDLTFLHLPDDLLDKLAKDSDMERGVIPNGLLRGIDHPIPTVVRTGTAIYGRTDTPDDFAYTVAKAMDEHQDLLQWSHLNFSYNIHNVWKASGVPLHPGAARYYREMGYMK